MTARQLTVLALCGGLLTLAACSDEFKDRAREAYNSSIEEFVPKDVDVKAVRSIKTLTINTVAVMPLIDHPPPGGEPLAPGGADAITAELYSQATVAGGWVVIPEDDAVQALQNMPPTTPQDLDQNARALGRTLSADGVLYGTVERYQERVGLDYSAASPAAVTFRLKFVDMKSGEIVWQANFAKSQKALSQNLFSLANFVQNSGRWVRAHEIAAEGVKEAVNDLHGRITLASSNVQRFEVRSYGQLKSGSMSFTSHNTPGGAYEQGQ
ncbi:MAG TPA: GNA1162 family protein [Candidatus Binataceae bacterium]|nr:GNA1162 family protein [Candidatus Binataceae bacterium]